MATFDYTSRDFLSIRQDLLARAGQTIPEWNGTDSSEFANMFVDLWAYMGDILHFYVDRAAGETFLETATQRESIQAIANLMDYIPSSSRAGRGQVTVKLNTLPSGATSYVVPRYTTFKGYDADGNDYNFYLANDSLALDLTTTTQSTGSVVQGSIINGELIGVSTGFTNQKFSLLKTNVDIESITIYVYEGPLVSSVASAIEYTYVPQLSSSNYTDKVFTARTTSAGYTQIIFGNGFNGTVPTTNANITASYRTTNGSKGNLPANGITFVTSSPQATYISVVSSGAISGGADVESIESIKTNVARLYRTQDRAVSLQDYKDLILQIAGVSKATAVYGQGGVDTVSGAVSGTTVTFTSPSAHGLVVGQKVTITGGTGASYRGTNLTIQTVPTTLTFTINTTSYGSAPTGTTTGATATAANTVVLYPVIYQSTYPPAPSVTDPTKVVIPITINIVESVEIYFSTRSMLGVDARVVSGLTTLDDSTAYIECTPIYVGIQVYVKTNYVQSYVKAGVDKAIRNLLSFDNVSFGQIVTVGEVYRAALSVIGVDYVILTNLSTTYDSTPATISTVNNVAVSATKLPCFTDNISSQVAVNFSMVGGLTGSN